MSEVLFERDGPLVIVTFNRPETRNAMTFAMYEGLYDACERVDADPEGAGEWASGRVGEWGSGGVGEKGVGVQGERGWDALR